MTNTLIFKSTFLVIVIGLCVTGNPTCAHSRQSLQPPVDRAAFPNSLPLEDRRAAWPMAVTLVAQSASRTFSSPKACLEKIDRLNARTYRKAFDLNRPVDVKTLDRQKARIANQCLAPLSINSVSTANLPAFAKLLFAAQRGPEADKAIARYLKSWLAAETRKADLLQQALNYSLYFARPADDTESAERYVRQFEELTPVTTRQRINAHSVLVWYYLKHRDDTKALRHETEILTLSKLLPANEQKTALGEIVSSMETLALMKCSEEGADRARAIIEQIPTDLIGLAKAENQIAVSLNRYQLFGRVPQLFPAHVLNAPGREGAPGPLKGQVTVILLAAHWCGPCHAIYPQVIEVYRRFQASGVQVLLVTELSNSVADPKAPKPEEELATIQKLYINELKMPFPILVETAINANSSGDVATKKAEMDRKESLFSFYPMLLVIDKQIRTRAILPGALPGQGERLRTKIEELLKEN